AIRILAYRLCGVFQDKSDVPLRRGSLGLRRKNIYLDFFFNLSLAAKLTQKGREQAAKIYEQRTGTEMALPPEDEKQITIFDNH
ncbi:hypothetical protein QO225_23335, partial [Vibrio vulnificus]|uniref:hypothetical protein n=1 Tax=Vibrio vulnificus TaxID=672 RepID=UPI0024DFFECC